MYIKPVLGFEFIVLKKYTRKTTSTSRLLSKQDKNNEQDN